MRVGAAVRRPEGAGASGRSRPGGERREKTMNLQAAMRRGWEGRRDGAGMVGSAGPVRQGLEAVWGSGAESPMIRYFPG